MTKQRFSWFLVFMSILTFGCLGLAWWQWERLDWKESILSSMSSAYEQGIRPYDPAHDEPIKFVHIEGVSGPLWHKISVIDGLRGYTILAPLTLSDGSVVAAKLGFVPEEAWDELKNTEGLKVKGDALLMEAPRASFFAPDADKRTRMYFHLDPRIVGANPDIYVELLDEPSVDAQMHKSAGADMFIRRSRDAVLAGIPNNHLQYAGTWALFALVGFVGMFFWWRSSRKRPS